MVLRAFGMWWRCGGIVTKVGRGWNEIQRHIKVKILLHFVFLFVNKTIIMLLRMFSRSNKLLIGIDIIFLSLRNFSPTSYFFHVAALSTPTNIL